MPKKIAAVLLICIFLFVPAGFCSAQNILYQENFNQGIGDWQGHAQGWSWEATGGESGGAYHYLWQSSFEEDSFAILKNKNWTDISFEAKVKILSGNAGISIRNTVDDINKDTPQLTGYRLILTPNSLRFQRYRLTQPNGQIGDHRNPFTLKEKPFSYVANQWYKLKIEAWGANFKCYVNDNLEIEYDDVSAMTDYETEQGKTHPNGPIFLNGSIGFIEYKANAFFNEVKVTDLTSREGRVYSEWKKDNWFGSWKWQGKNRVATQPEEDSLIIHFEGKPFEVIFWDGRDGGTKMPHWRMVGDKFGICPIWFESGDSPDWEPLFTDRSLIKLEILEERSDFIRVRWWYKPTKDRQGSYGGSGFEVHRGNTEVEQIFDFYANGLTEGTMNIKLGNQNFSNQSGNDMELFELNFLFPLNKKPLDVVGRENKIVKVMDPYTLAETSMDLNGQGLDKNLVNNWDGQIYLFYNKDKNADFFSAWGKKVNPLPPPDLFLRPVGLYYENNGVNMVWPKPSCNISAPLMAKAFLPNDRYVANLTYKWLIGMGDISQSDLRKTVKDWLETGKIEEPNGTPSVSPAPTITGVIPTLTPRPTTFEQLKFEKGWNFISFLNPLNLPENCPLISQRTNNFFLSFLKNLLPSQLSGRIFVKCQ